MSGRISDNALEYVDGLETKQRLGYLLEGIKDEVIVDALWDVINSNQGVEHDFRLHMETNYPDEIEDYLHAQSEGRREDDAFEQHRQDKIDRGE